MGQTLLDRWIEALKNNRLIAFVLFLGIVVVTLASFTDAMKSLKEFFSHGPTGPGPEIHAFESIPGQIRAGDSAVIQWKVSGADSVQIDNEIGTVPLSGSRGVSPTKTTTYTLTATGQGSTKSSTLTLNVATESAFDGALMLNDVFAGDAGWKLPQDSAFQSSIGGGRFQMRWVDNRSAQCVTRPVNIGADDNFSLQATVNATQDTGYALGICWDVSGGQANYKLYVEPGGNSSAGYYQLVRDEIWQQAGPDGSPHPYGQSVNLLDPSDVNHRFSSTAIHPGTGTNVLTVVRRGDKLRIYINDTYVNEASYSHAPINAVGMFISGQVSAEFRDFSVRVAK